MSASGTQGDQDEEINTYLSRKNVEAVDLPKKWGQDKTYPPVILDAASGTGKTQQAFALVQKHEGLIYFLMSKPSKGDQRIYKSMRKLTSDKNKKRRFAYRVEVAIKALGKETKTKTSAQKTS